jgi:hypothetical protein
VEVYLHADYRQFRRLRRAGEVVNLRENIVAGLIARGDACPVMDGQHQCQLSNPSLAAVAPVGYEDEMLESPADRVMLPVKWSHSKRARIRGAAHRSVRVRRVVRGRLLHEIQPSELGYG